MTSSGALRFGQWPVAFRITSLLFGMCWCTYSPTASGAMTSSLHCRISVGIVTLREVGAVVGIERDARELLGDVGVGAAEAVGELLAKLRPVGIAHDHRRHRGRPAHVIVGEEVQQLGDLLLP